MKTKKIISSILLSAIALPFFSSCNPDEVIEEIPEISTGVVVLNEGQMGNNNSSLTYYDFTTGFSSNEVFNNKNNRNLGDVGQDMIKYGSKIYLAVSNSSIIEIIDAKTFVSKKTISMKNASNVPSTPRSLTSANGKVYITLFDGHVAQLDTTSLIIEKTIAVGSNPEGSVIVNNKLYVANSGGLSLVNDSTISVIDLASFTETEKIKVVINPTIIKADSYGDIYVISVGNYYNIPYTLQRINTITKVVTKITDVKAYKMTIDGDNAYIYNYDYDASYKVINKTYTIYDVKNEKLLKSNFIASDAVQNTPYSIDVNPITKDIYIGETLDYKTTGKMYCFSSNGTLKYTFPTGVNPSKTVFISNK
jgi:hypothetical protein